MYQDKNVLERRMTGKITLICDYCGKTIETYGFSMVDLPKEWYAIAFHSGHFAAYDDWRVTHHFCCKEHLDKSISFKDINDNQK